MDTHRNTHSDIEHGSAEWDDPDTANKRMADLKHPENNRILSKHVNQALSGSKSFPNNNMIVVGAPGTGKSLFVIAPNILKCISSYLFMDLKVNLWKIWKLFAKERLSDPCFELKKHGIF